MQLLRLALAVILMLSGLLSSGQNHFRKHINFDNDWKFAFGDANNPIKDFNYRIETIFSKSGSAPGTAIDSKFNDSSWRSLNLPHDWAVELPFANVKNNDVEAHGYKAVGGLFPETSIGWYRKHFDIDKIDSGKRFQIQFDGIYRNAKIWINGFYVGNNMSGYIGAAYDVTDFINFTGDNVLVLRVDATQYEGWFYEGAGIYRHVWLNEYDKVHINDGGIFIHASVHGNNANVSIETTVQNQNADAANCIVSSYIADRDGNKIVQSKDRALSIKQNNNATIQQNLNVKNATLWSLENPYLYRVVVELKSAR